MFPTATLKKRISTGLLLQNIFNIIVCLNLSVPIEVLGQSRPIVITADQPNVWTLEQAHYLLAQMHRRNLDLKARKLTDSDLDANALNGTRLDILKTFLEINASYNQAAAFDNRLVARNKELNARRLPRLIQQRDDLNEINISLTRQIAILESQLKRAEGDEEKNKISAELDEKKAERAVIKEEITQVDNEIKTTNSASTTFTATAPSDSFDPAKIPTGALDSVMKKTLEDSANGLTDPPQLNASLQLENYLQMQYEILAKQLTLLRDEVGPGERLLFLEIPQSIRATRSKADNKWAQTWFKIAGYTCSPSDKLPCPDDPVGTTGQTQQQQLQPQQQQQQQARQQQPQVTPQQQQQLQQQQVQQQQQQQQQQEQQQRQEQQPQKAPQTNREKANAIFSNERESQPDQQTSKQKFYTLTERTITGYKQTGDTGSSKVSNREVRVVDLIPRQSSLNVNDVNLRTNSSGFGFIASFLFGFGASGKYQRQREQFSQFVQQELYSSGFGKGRTEFGWTFTPMPGTDRVMSGTRTTYAIVVVPKNATSLVLESSGCYFPRSEYQPTDFKNTQTNWRERADSDDDERKMCTKQESVVVFIPRGGIGVEAAFKVDSLEYKSVEPNQRMSMTIKGKSFPTQIGVIVGGTSLVQSIGLAQPLIEDDSTARANISARSDPNGSAIYGEFERLSDEQITFWFKMPKDYIGTPPISIVAPGEAKLLNHDETIQLIVNGDRSKRKEGDSAQGDSGVPKYDLTLDNAPYLFGKRLTDKNNELRIEGFDVYRKSATEVTVVLRGEKLTKSDKLLINGQAFDKAKATDLYWIETYAAQPEDEFIQLTLVTQNNVLQPGKVKNPLYNPSTKPQSAKVEPTAGGETFKVTRTALEEFVPRGENTPAQLIIRLEGKGFNDTVTASTGRFTFTNETLSFLTLENPPPSLKIKLTDDKNKLFTEITIIKSEFVKNPVDH